MDPLEKMAAEVHKHRREGDKSNAGLDIWALFGTWVPFVVGYRAAEPRGESDREER